MKSPATLGNHRHWHHVYKRRRRRALGINSKQIAIGQMISLIGAVLAGYHLDNNKSALALIVGVFVILPGVLDLNGSLGGALSAKINHRLEDSKAQVWKIYVHTVSFALLIALLAGSVVGLMGGLIAAWIFAADFWTIFRLALGAIMVGSSIGFPLIGLATVILRKIGVNPDDVMGPIETSFFDFLAVFALVMVAGWIV